MTSSAAAPRVLIADDQAMLRQMLAAAVESRWPQARVGQSHDYASTLGFLAAEPWDLLLLDLHFSGGRGGLEILEHVRALKTPPAVLVLTSYTEEKLGARCITLGARGYLQKGASLADLYAAMEEILQGRLSVSPAITSDLALMAQGYAPEPHKRLTNREMQVFLSLAAGKTVTETAGELRISVKTAWTHRASILEKMQLDSNGALIRYALENHLLPPSE